MRNNEVNEAILESYEAVELVKLQREKDWKTILNLRLVILLSKFVGFGLITWGRNINDWPTDVDILNVVPTNYYLGITGRALQYSLFLVDDFREGSDLICLKSDQHNVAHCRGVLEYEEPSCGSDDLYRVLLRDKFSPLLSGDPGTLTEVQRKILLVEFRKEVKACLSCLSSVPSQFYDLDIVLTKKAVKVLNDRLEDLFETVSNI